MGWDGVWRAEEVGRYQVSRRHMRSFSEQEARIREWISGGKELKRGKVSMVEIGGGWEELVQLTIDQYFINESIDLTSKQLKERESRLINMYSKEDSPPIFIFLSQ